MKSNRNLSRGEGRRLGNAALIAFMLGSLLVLSLVRARFSPIGKTGEAIKAEEQQAMRKESVKMETLETTDEAAASAAEEEEEETQPKPADTSGGGGVSSTAVASATTDHLSKPVCYESSRRSDTCEAAGDVRVQGRSQTIHIHPLEQEWKVKPYCRKHDAFALSHVKEWSLRPLSGDDSAAAAPHCTVNSSATAFVLSTGGFTGNLFHDYTDVLIPAFITAHRFAGEVQFLVSSFKSWWTNRYLQIFQKLSKYEVVDIDNDDEVRCYRSVVVGPTFHKELGVDASKTPSGYSMVDFRAMLRGAFGLERAAAEPSGDRWDIRRRPRLLIISRRSSRAFLNERAMADMAMSLAGDTDASLPHSVEHVPCLPRRRDRFMAMWMEVFLAARQMGQESSLGSRALHRHRCRQGSSSIDTSRSPQHLHAHLPADELAASSSFAASFATKEQDSACSATAASPRRGSSSPSSLPACSRSKGPSGGACKSEHWAGAGARWSGAASGLSQGQR